MAFNPEETHSLRSLSPISSHNNLSHGAGLGTSQQTSAYHRQSHDVEPLTAQKESLAHREPSRSPRARFHHHPWRLEILAWLFGAVTLAILIIVLASFNTRALSRWHSNVSVNTLVNVLTTIASTALNYPVASAIAQLGWLYLNEQHRPLSDLETFASGPLNASNMVLRHPSRPLVLLGTANVILLLLFSPITQEAIDLPIRQHNTSFHTESVPIVLAYQAGNWEPRTVYTNADTTDYPSKFHYQSVDRAMALAIQSAIIGTLASPSDVTAHCQTGNCTFPAYSSMGICSKVEDVTPTNRTICRLENDGIGGTLTNCGYTVQELQKHPNKILYPVSNGKKLRYTLWIGVSNDEYPNPNTLVEFYAIYLSNTSTPSSDIQEGTSDTVVALKGSLNLCVLSYQTQMRNGITETVEISRKDNLTWQTKGKNVCDGGSSSCPVIASSDGGTEYWMESVNREAFNHYLGLEIFHGYTTVGLNLVSNDETGLIDTAASIAGMVVNKTVSEGQDELAKWLNNLAQAMTNSLRETAVQKGKARGVTAVPEIYIAVQFRWLAGPIASVILSFIFLLAVIFQTSHRGVPPWKISSIAALLSLDHETAQLIASQDHGTSLKSRAKALRVRLGQGDDQGWSLRGV